MDKRFLTPTGLNQAGQYENISFDEYIERMHKIILQARHFIPEDHEKMATLNGPFRLLSSQGPTKGILMIHGLLETPFITRDLAAVFNEQGFEVRSVLLPGHGTVPGDLLDVSYEAWINAVKYAIKEFQKTTDTLYICGISTGAMLAINEALENENIRGLFLLVPANEIKSPLRLLSPFMNLHKVLCHIFPFMKWLDKLPETDSMKYHTCAVNAGIQLYKLTQHVNQQLEKKTLTTPMWMTVTTDDETLNPQVSIDFFQQQFHPKNRLLIFSSKVNHYNESNIQCVSSSIPEENIVSISHVSISVSPHNFHYGKNGDYTLLCRQHIKTKNPVFGAINDAEKLWLDAKDTIKLQDNRLYRLHYNPHFETMTASILGFLMGLS